MPSKRPQRPLQRGAIRRKGPNPAAEFAILPLQKLKLLCHRLSSGQAGLLLLELEEMRKRANPTEQEKLRELDSKITYVRGLPRIFSLSPSRQPPQ